MKLLKTILPGVLFLGLAQAEVIELDLEKAIELALEGDMAALKLCLDRIVPVRKTRPVKFHLPTIETPDDVLKAMQSIIQSVADGDTTPDDAQSVMALLDQTRRTQEHVDFDKRLTALENLQ